MDSQVRNDDTLYGWDLATADCIVLGGVMAYIVDRKATPEGTMITAVIEQPFSSVGYPLYYVSRTIGEGELNDMTMVYSRTTQIQ